LPLRALSADLCFLICRPRDDLADDRRAVARGFGRPKPRSSAADLRCAGVVNPLASHWFRIAVLLFIASPAVALLVVLTTSADFATAIALTLYMWALVCVILALIAFAGLIVRVLGRGLRALRR